MFVTRPRTRYAQTMARTDFTTPRLCVVDDLSGGGRVALEPEAANYLFNVLRLAAGARVLCFNGRDGEWSGTLVPVGRGDAAI